MKSTFIAIIHRLNVPALVSDKRMGKPLTLQRFNREHFKTTKFYATLLPTESLQHFLREKNTTDNAVLKYSIQKIEYQYRHGLISVNFFHDRCRKSESRDATIEGPPARQNLKNLGRWLRVPGHRIFFCPAGTGCSRAIIRRWSHGRFNGVQEEWFIFDATRDRFPKLDAQQDFTHWYYQPARRGRCQRHSFVCFYDWGKARHYVLSGSNSYYSQGLAGVWLHPVLGPADLLPVRLRSKVHVHSPGRALVHRGKVIESLHIYASGWKHISVIQCNRRFAPPERGPKISVQWKEAKR